MSFESLFDTVSRYKSISEQAKQALMAVVQKKKYPKGYLLVKAGKVCQELYFLEKGCLRAYYDADGKEVTSWFAFEDSFATSFYSFISQQPALENIVLMEEAELIVIRYQDLQNLYTQFHELETLGRLINEQYYVKLEERIVSRQFKTAKEIYDALLQNTPHILQRVPLGYVASYLGITQETLSRIRGKV